MGKSTGQPNGANGIPDYAKLAKDQANYGTRLARYNQTTPFGSSTWTDDGDGKWSLSNTLSPAQQQILDQQNQYSLGVGNQMNSALQNLNFNSINPADLPAAPVNAGQTAQDAIMSRLQPQLANQRETLRTQLVNQGIRQGTAAWDNAMAGQNQRENDLLTQASLQGISASQAARNSALQERIALQNQPINLLNALRGGQNLQVPQFAGTGGYSNPDLTGAAQNTYNANMGLYNADVSQNNNFWNGLYGLGGAFLSGYPWGK